MLRSLYSAASSMLVMRKKMDVVTNNITNADTTGFKKDLLLSRSFKDMMIEKTGDPSILNISNQVGKLNTGVHVDEIATSYSQGNAEETGRAADLMIQGEGFFTISTSQGERYTRDGNFTVDSEGYLVTNDGNSVMGTSGKIKVGSEKFSVDENGNVTVEGKTAGKLKLASFEDPTCLRKTGNNLYINFENAAVGNTEDAKIRQGYLETSNVEIATEMVDMLQVYRSYETNQRMIKMLDESLGKAVNEVGRV